MPQLPETLFPVATPHISTFILTHLIKEVVLTRWESKVAGLKRQKGGCCKDRGEKLTWLHKDMETAWEAEQTMSLQVSYLCGGNEVGASVGESQSLMWVPETPAGSRGGGAGLVLVWCW